MTAENFSLSISTLPKPESKGKVVVLHLSNGEEIIGMISRNTIPGFISLSKPHMVLVQPNGNQLSINLPPYPLFTATSNNNNIDLEYDLSHVIWAAKPPVQMENAYRKVTGRLQIAEGAGILQA